MGSDGLSVDWGRQKCWVRLMGETCNLFDFNFGTEDVSWPGTLGEVAKVSLAQVKSVLDIGLQLADCPALDQPEEVVKCLGFKIIGLVPPFNFLNRMGNMLTEFIEVFALVAATVVRQVLEDGQSLVQQAVVSKFPSAGAPAVLHHAGKNLRIKTHSQHPKGRQADRPRSTLQRGEPPGESLLQRGDGEGESNGQGSINFEVHDQEGNYATKLITQSLGCTKFVHFRSVDLRTLPKVLTIAQ